MGRKGSPNVWETRVLSLPPHARMTTNNVRANIQTHPGLLSPIPPPLPNFGPPVYALSPSDIDSRGPSSSPTLIPPSFSDSLKTLRLPPASPPFPSPPSSPPTHLPSSHVSHSCTPGAPPCRPLPGRQHPSQQNALKWSLRLYRIALDKDRPPHIQGTSIPLHILFPTALALAGPAMAPEKPSASSPLPKSINFRNFFSLVRLLHISPCPLSAMRLPHMSSSSFSAYITYRY